MSGSAKKPPKNQKLPIFGVNLLIHKSESVKLQYRLLSWLLSSGKYIAIFVEIIVIACVVMKYKLDDEKIALDQQINEEVKYIQSLAPDELAIRETQFSLATIKQIHKNNIDFSSILFHLAAITPTRIVLNSVTFNHPTSNAPYSLAISGQTPSNVELSVFIQTLQKDPLFTGITLTNISFQDQTVFTITGSLAPTGGQSS